MRLCKHVQKAAFVAIAMLLVVASTALAASFMAPQPYDTETGDQDISASGSYANNNSRGGILSLGGGVAGTAKCGVMFQWWGDFETPSVSGLTPYTLSIDLNDINGQFTEGTSIPIYVVD